jgi:hypothetical protein
MTMNLLTSSSISRVNAGLSAGTGTTTTSAVNVTGYAAVSFLVNLSTVAATGSATLSVQGSDNGSDWTSLEGSVTRDAAGVLAIEVERPMFEQVRAQLVRADANVTTDAVMAIRQRASQNPVEDTGQTVAVLVSPDAA